MGTTRLEVIEGIDVGCGVIGASGRSGCGSLEPAANTALVPVDDAGLPAESGGRRNQRGMVSAEWAVGIIAAIGIAGVLIAVVTNGAVQEALLKFVLQLIHSFSGYMTNH
ncbi:MAG: DUF4244 domain-containing protein [Microlunatus sp.]